MRAAKWIGLSLLAAAATACFTADFKSGTVRCSSDPTQLCPTNYTCVSGYCYSSHSLDGGSQDGFILSTD